MQSQLRIASGESLAELGLSGHALAQPRGYAIQTRVNMETLGAERQRTSGGGTLTAYEAPSGPGVRTDGFGYVGYETSVAFDSLLAKVISHSPTPRFEDAVTRATRALSEFRIEGVQTNIPFLQNVLAHGDFTTGGVHTRWVDANIAELAGRARTTASATWRRRRLIRRRASRERGWTRATRWRCSRMTSR